MQQIRQPIAKALKDTLMPEQYYMATLGGSFGRPTGNSWYAWGGLCPFHEDKKFGSFFVNKDSGAYRCFSCGAKGGDIIDFHMQKNCLGFKDTLIQLEGYTACAK